MNKNKSAAGLRRSAIAERIRLREEWSELKGRVSQPNVRQKNNILKKNQRNAKTASAMKKASERNTPDTGNLLYGVVALVEVGAEPRALPLRAALSALGASVLPSWSPLVTHLIWSKDGCRATRARARALAVRLVSPQWVEACAAAARRLPEQAYPAAVRPSDLPSPKTLTTMLKKAETGNILLADWLADNTGEKQNQFRLRISSEPDSDADTSGGTKSNKPQRAAPTQPEAPPAKSRRKLFTQKEAEQNSDDSAEDALPKFKKPSLPAAKPRPSPTKRRRRSRRIVIGARCSPVSNQGKNPKIVLSGMDRAERRAVGAAVLALGGRLQAAVGARTTHVLLGSFLPDHDYLQLPEFYAPPEPQVLSSKLRTLNALTGAARGCLVLHARWALLSRDEGTWIHYCGHEVPHLWKISEKARLERTAWGKLGLEYGYNVFCGMRVRVASDVETRDEAVKLLKLCGAVALEGDEITRRVPTQNGALAQNGGRIDASQFYVTQRPDCEYDVSIGNEDGDVHVKWVFDSIAAARMRKTRRYLVTDSQHAQMK